MRTIIIIPAYNEERTVGEVVRNVRAHVPDVIVVDDGSDDATGDRARHAGARVITHCVNRGLGAALGTGLAAALGHRVLGRSERTLGHRVLKRSEERATGKHPVSGSKHEETHPDVEERARHDETYPDTIVTLDADGQHDPADIAAVIAPIQAGFADLVIGTRTLGHRVLKRSEERATGKHPVSGAVHEEPRAEKHRVLRRSERARGKTSGVDGKTPDVEERATPFFRHLANSIANLLTRFLFHVRCSDTQSGFRAFSRRAASLIDIRTNRMEVSSEILAEAARLSLRIAEVPIRTIYTEYSLAKGQSFTVGLQTAWRLLLRRLF